VQSFRQQLDVEHLFPVLGLFFFQKVEQQRRQATLLRCAGHMLIARAEPAASTAVGERYDPIRAWRYPQDAAQPPPAR